MLIEFFFQRTIFLLTRMIPMLMQSLRMDSAMFHMNADESPNSKYSCLKARITIAILQCCQLNLFSQYNNDISDVTTFNTCSITVS